MITVLESFQFAEHQALLDKMYRLRAYVFGDKLGWNLSVSAGRERDKYDDLNPVYLLYTDQAREEVFGSLRLLPTTGPTLLYEVFGEAIPEGVDFVAPHIWECTRFCVDEEL